MSARERWHALQQMRRDMNKAVTIERSATPVVTPITGMQAFMAVLWAANLVFFLYYLVNYAR